MGSVFRSTALHPVGSEQMQQHTHTCVHVCRRKITHYTHMPVPYLSAVHVAARPHDGLLGYIRADGALRERMQQLLQQAQAGLGGQLLGSCQLGRAGAACVKVWNINVECEMATV